MKINQSILQQFKNGNIILKNTNRDLTRKILNYVQPMVMDCIKGGGWRGNKDYYEFKSPLGITPVPVNKLTKPMVTSFDFFNFETSDLLPHYDGFKFCDIVKRNIGKDPEIPRFHIFYGYVGGDKTKSIISRHSYIDPANALNPQNTDRTIKCVIIVDTNTLTLYTQPQPIIKEVTLAEVAEKFGVDPTLIRIKK